LIQRRIRIIKNGEFESAIPLDACLVYRMLDNLAPDEMGPFYPARVDSRDANILTDDVYNITGIIDRHMASVTAKGGGVIGAVADV
jgi:hypothetical protein